MPFSDLRTVSFVAVAACAVACGDSEPSSRGTDPTPAEEVTILRDLYGVPHIYGESRWGAMFGQGWVEIQDHGPTLLRSFYGAVAHATRNMPECGQTCLEMDVTALLFDIPGAVERDFELLASDTRAHLEAYAAGVNAYLADSFSETFEPVTPQMVVASGMYRRIEHARSATQSNITPGGSNQFALTGARTVPDTTFALKDPHNFWTDNEPFVHRSWGDFDIVGNSFNGAVACGATRQIAYGCTRSAPATAVLVRAAVRFTGLQSGNGVCGEYSGYEYFDHRVGDYVPFSMTCLTVEDESGGTAWTGWRFDSRFGPVTAVGDDGDGDGRPDELFALHVFAATDVSIYDYWVAREVVTGADAFLELFSAPTPREDAQYRSFASAEHRVGLVEGAAVPDLDPSVDWAQPVSSDDPRIDSWNPNADWHDGTGVDWYNVDGTAPELPHVIDPVGDFVLNANGSPTHGTEPTAQVGDVPTFIEARADPTTREERLRELLVGATNLDVEAAKAIATDLVVVPARRLVDAMDCRIALDSTDPVARWGVGGELLEILRAWRAEGFQASPESVATTVMFLLEGLGAPVYPAEGACLSATQLDGLGVFMRDSVAPYMQTTYAASHVDPLRVPWGYLNFQRLGGQEVGLPGIGGRIASVFVSFFAFDLASGRSDPAAHGGSRVTQVTSYSPGGFETFIMTPQGQIAETRYPSSPHIGQTIDDYVNRRFRRVWTDRAEVEAHLCPWGDPAHPDFEPDHEHGTRTVLRFR